MSRKKTESRVRSPLERRALDHLTAFRRDVICAKLDRREDAQPDAERFHEASRAFVEGHPEMTIAILTQSRSAVAKKRPDGKLVRFSDIVRNYSPRLD